MIFSIDPNSPKHVYQQIINQVRFALADGRLRAGDRLPAIRDLAVQTRVNRNTVARAYQDLERQGVIRSKTGRGSFVRDDAPSEAEQLKARQDVVDLIDEALAQARLFQMGKAEVRDLFSERLSEATLKGTSGK